MLVAVESAQVREASGRDAGALDGFESSPKPDNDEAAVEAARRSTRRLALIEPELPAVGAGGPSSRFRRNGWRAWSWRWAGAPDGALAQLVGAQSYVQMGTSPRDLLSAVQAAHGVSAQAGRSQAPPRQKHDLLPDADAVLEEPALVDL